MKTIKIMLLPAVIMLLFVMQASAQNNTIIKSVNAVINNYIDLKNALAAGDGNAASAKAKILLSSVNVLPKGGLSADLVTLTGKLEYDSRHISEVPHVAHQREHFASLSNNLYILVKKLNINQITLYRQYCKVDKRYFLSESDKGKDPYMGMTNCSKVVETLPAIKK